MKNIIVFSLWGDHPIYWKGALRNIELAKTNYPKFICRFYIDKNCNSELIETIKGDNVEVVLMEPETYNYSNMSIRFNHSGLFWRFLPLKEEDIDIILFKDCDSRISEREVNAVNEWLSTDKDFHIMRDHPYHPWPILTGMWGCRNNKLLNIDELLLKWKTHTTKGVYQAEDQDFLGQFIYPLTIASSVEHSEFGIRFGSETKTFPTIRNDYEFVGDVFDENNNRHPDYWKLIKNTLMR
jgi:hypothetical protein